MKDVRDYMKEYNPALERLEALLERVQYDAFDEGYRRAADHMFEMAKETISRVDKLTAEALA